MEKPSKINWDAIKTEYITTHISLRDLAEKYGVSSSQVCVKSRTEKWVDQRESYRRKLTAKATQKAATRESNRLAKLIAATTKAVDVATKALEDDKQFNRYIVTEGLGVGITETSEKVFEKVDTKALKDLVSVIKDTTALLRDFYNLPTPAQAEAQRIAAERLEMDRKKADADSNDGAEITIIMDDSLDDFSK